MTGLINLLQAVSQLAETFGNIIGWEFVINILGETYVFSLWGLLTPPLILLAFMLKIIKLIPGA